MVTFMGYQPQVQDQEHLQTLEDAEWDEFLKASRDRGGLPLSK